MADPLSLSASIIAILSLSATIVQYLNNVKTATKDRQSILHEVASATYLLTLFKDLAEQAQWGEAWSVTVASLATPNGPLEQFKMALERLATKLKPLSGIQKVRKAFDWPFEKEEVKDILGIIERQKTLFSLAIQNDNMQVRDYFSVIGNRYLPLTVDSLEPSRIMSWTYRQGYKRSTPGSAK